MYHETEAETRAQRIDPVLAAAGWGVIPAAQIRREVICPGRIQTGDKRGKGLACDYVLVYKGHKLATLEAKRAGVSFREGIGQTKARRARLPTWRRPPTGARRAGRSRRPNFCIACSAICPGWWRTKTSSGRPGATLTPASSSWRSLGIAARTQTGWTPSAAW